MAHFLPRQTPDICSHCRLRALPHLSDLPRLVLKSRRSDHSGLRETNSRQNKLKDGAVQRNNSDEHPRDIIMFHALDPGHRDENEDRLCRLWPRHPPLPRQPDPDVLRQL